jgi:hypothetical protein
MEYKCIHAVIFVFVGVIYSGEYDVVPKVAVRQTFQLARCGCTRKVTSQT